MAVKEDSPQTEPLASTKHYPHKSDLESSSAKITDWPPHPSYYHPPPQKSSSKCFVYIFTIIVLLSFLLFIFSLVVFKTKRPGIHLHSVQLTSLRFDASSLPFFYAAMSAQIRLDNSNFGPLEINSVEISVVYGNSNTNSAKSFVGGGEMKPADKWRIGARKGEEVTGRRVAVEVVSEKVEMLRSQGGERDRLRNQLSSGVLELTWRVKVTGDVTLFGKIRRRAEGWTECLVSIDLQSEKVNRLLC